MLARMFQHTLEFAWRAFVPGKSEPDITIDSVIKCFPGNPPLSFPDQELSSKSNTFRNKRFRLALQGPAMEAVFYGSIREGSIFIFPHVPFFFVAPVRHANARPKE